MLQPIECQGAPRDMGLDQGSVCGDAVRAWIDERGILGPRRWLPSPRRLTGGGALGAGVGREVLRHYPHLGERMSGLARASRVSLDALMETLVIAAYGNGGDPIGAAAPACAAPGETGALALARPADARAPWILRRSRPEIGFASVELGLPWLASAVAGVNDQGIAVMLAPTEARLQLRGLAGPPAFLLVQECLQRFDSLDGAIEWCLKRPAAGSLGIVLGDAYGEAAAVEFSGAGARLVRSQGAVVSGGSSVAESALRKAVVEEGRLSRAAFAADEAPAQVWLDPRARSLSWHGEAAPSSTPQVLVAEA